MRKNLVLLLLGPSLLISQTKTWTLTTAVEFSPGILSNVVITNVNGGELRLAHPLVRQGNDTLDSSIPQFVSYDDAGNYAVAWVSGERLTVQKFDANRQPLTAPIVADDSGGLYRWSTTGIALLNSGKFVVGWTAQPSWSGYVLRYVQFFDAAGNKIGTNLRVFSQSNGTASIPQPIADRMNERYIILSPEKVSAENSFQLYSLLYSGDGVKLRDSIDFIPSGGMFMELNPRGAMDHGRLIVAWSGDNDNLGPGDIYAALYDSNCVPITAPILLAQHCSSAAAAFDDKGNSCVTWNSSVGFVPPDPPDRIYAQVLDPSMHKIGGVVQVSNLSAGSVVHPQIEFLGGRFRVVWQSTLSNGQPPLQWTSYWKLEEITNGTYLSPVFDAGISQTLFEKIAWTASPPADTRVVFRLRSSATAEGIQSAPWLGPTSDSDYYIDAAGQTINAQHDNNRYLQAKAFFESLTLGNSPVLEDFTVSYMSADTIPPAVPSNLAAKSEHRRIVLNWTPTTSPDVMKYAIYRTVGLTSSSHSLLTQVDAGTLSFVDSAVVFDSIYIYGVAAIDSAWNATPTKRSEPVSPGTMLVFVSTSGTTQGDGTTTKPFSQINDAVAFSGKGDTVYVMPGEYNCSIALKDHIALIGSGALTTTVISPPSSMAVSTGSDNLIKGFTFLTGAGIQCHGNNVTITENIFTHQGGNFDLAIGAVSQVNTVIAKNIILGYAMGIQSVSTPPSSNAQTTIRNNIIRCSMAGVQSVGSDVSCINNSFIIEGTSATGISGDGNLKILNNCFAGVPAEGSYHRSISINPYGATAQIQYNDRWNTDGDSQDTVDATNIKVDPQFKNVSKGNFHLQPASLCRNAGNPTAQYNDLDGSRNDIGSYGGPDPLPDYLTFALTTDISLNSVSGFPGDTVSVGVALSNPAGLKQGTIEIHFDPAAMSFLRADPTNLTAGFSLQTERPSGNRIVVTLSGAGEISSGSGTIVNLRFILNAGTQPDKQTAIEIGRLSLFDGDGNSISISSVKNGSCVVRAKSGYISKVFVDGNYTGVGDGTILRPYSTIQKGIENAKPGDTVVVAAGIYAGPVIMRSRVYVVGLGANVTTIKCPDDPLIFPQTVVSFNNVDSTGIEGFTLVNYASIGEVVDIMSSKATLSKNKIDQSGMAFYSVIAHDSSRVTIRDNYFVESQYGGFQMISISMSDAVIACNVFSPSAAIELVSLNSAGRTLVRNNRFYLTAESMVGVTGYTTKRVLVANNLFFGTAINGFGVKLYNADSALVVNNVFDTVKDGIDENSGTQEIENNVFLGNDVATNLGSSTKHEYNLFWNNKLKFGTGQQDLTEITADPLFVDQPHGNYKLSSSSPALNAGSPAPAWNDLNGTRNDIGIFGGPYADTTMFLALNSKLRIASVPGSPGDTIIVPISAMGISGISGLKVLLTFDADRLSLLQAHTTALTQDFVLDRKNIGNSLVELTLQGSRTLVIDSGAVMTLEFVAGSHATGTVPLKFQTVQLYGASTQTAEGVSFENGGITLGPDAVGPNPNIPREFVLYQNFPNPFNPSTTIRYSVPVRTDVQLKIFDILGREMIARRFAMQPAGSHEIRFDVSALSSGTYFYQLRAGSFVQTKKMLIVR